MKVLDDSIKNQRIIEKLWEREREDLATTLNRLNRNPNTEQALTIEIGRLNRQIHLEEVQKNKLEINEKLLKRVDYLPSNDDLSKKVVDMEHHLQKNY